MLDLSPVKILLVVIVAVILVGPDKLPQLARQLGSGWRRLRNLRDQLDRELRENIPDLPSTDEIARFARSPMTLLNQLAHTSADDLVEDPAAEAAEPSANGAAWPQDPAAEATAPVVSDVSAPAAGRLPEVPDDPNLN